MGAAWRRALVRSWSRRGPLAYVLWPVSWLYAVLVGARTWLYRHGLLRVERLPVPVIVVGNVVVGGAGKTPVVLAVVRHLQARGWRVGVVSRGYGRDAGASCREVLSDSQAREVGDEPLLIHRVGAVPVFVARKRVEAARALLARHPAVNVLLSDDGLQHLALYRDLEICVFGPDGVGNGMLLPSGPLREPWPRPVDLVLADSPTPGDRIWRMQRSLAPHARQADGTVLPVNALGQRPLPNSAGLWAVAGIAQPERFFAMLRAAGVQLAGTLALPDHAEFDDARWKSGAMPDIVCTEKDAVKLWRHRPDAWAVPLELRLPAGFWQRLDALLQTRATARLSSGHGHTTA